MASWKRTLFLVGVLVTLLESGHSFFLPSSWTNGWSSPPTTARKPDQSKWQPTFNFREYPYYQQHYTYDAPPQQMPVAVPYPVAIPAQHTQQLSLPVPQPAPVVAASIHSAVQNMKLVPCLCSVPNEAVEEDAATAANSHVVQTSQQIAS